MMPPSAIQTKVREQPGGHIYVEVEVGGKKLQGKVDMTIYTTKELADKINLSYKKERDYVEGVKVKGIPIYRVAQDAGIRVRPWRGKVDISVGPLDERKFYLRMDFLDIAKAIIVSLATCSSQAMGKSYAIPMRREVEKEMVLSSVRFTKSLEVGT